MTKTIPPKTFQRLFKRTVGGGTQFWDIAVEHTKRDTGILVIQYGLVGGKIQTQREEIEQGKNLGRSNATTAYEQAVLEAESRWKKQLERKGYGLDVEASAAVRSLSPMLALDFKKAKDIDWSTTYGQPKLDGFRCTARRVGKKIIMLSRENKPIVTMGHIAEQLLDALEDGQIVDGELYAHDMPFQKVASCIKREQDDSAKVLYNLYDMIADVPFRDRSDGLRSLLSPGYDALTLVETVMVRSKDDLMVYQQKCIEDGYEGAMLRHGKQGYDAGKRSKYLLKVKTFQDAEFKVVDVKEGRGTHKGMAIFTCETKEGNNFDVLAPGSHDEKRAYWENHPQWLGKPLTVKFQDWTTSAERVPRFPVALRFREG